MLNSIKDNVNKNGSAIACKLFSSMLTDSFLMPEYINLMLHQIGIQFGFKDYFVTTFYLTNDCKNNCKNLGYDADTIYFEIKDIIENQCKRITYDYITFTNIAHNIIILVIENLDRTSGKIVKFYEKALDIIKNCYNVNMIVGKSNNYSGIEKFIDAFCEAFQQVSKQKYFGYEKKDEGCKIISNEMFMDKRKSLKKSIKSCNIEKSNLIIDWICDAQRDLEIPLKQVKIMNAFILNDIVSILSEIECNNINRSYSDVKDIFEEMNMVAGEIENFEDSKKVLRKTSYVVIKIIEKINLKKKERLIGLVLDFIEKNYSRDITLCEMAEKCKMDCSIIGKAFKENLGETFSRYLINFRIKKAKEMLSATSLKVYEISRKVGYCDVKYFTSLFKSLEGVTPNGYRKSLERIAGK